MLPVIGVQDIEYAVFRGNLNDASLPCIVQVTKLLGRGGCALDVGFVVFITYGGTEVISGFPQKTQSIAGGVCFTAIDLGHTVSVARHVFNECIPLVVVHTGPNGKVIAQGQIAAHAVFLQAQIAKVALNIAVCCLCVRAFCVQGDGAG